MDVVEENDRAVSCVIEDAVVDDLGVAVGPVTGVDIP